MVFTLDLTAEAKKIPHEIVADLQEKVFFASEVVVEGALRNRGSVDDFLHTGCFVTMLIEELNGGVDELLSDVRDWPHAAFAAASSSESTPLARCGSAACGFVDEPPCALVGSTGAARSSTADKRAAKGRSASLTIVTTASRISLMSSVVAMQNRLLLHFWEWVQGWATRCSIVQYRTYVSPHLRLLGTPQFQGRRGRIYRRVACGPFSKEEEDKEALIRLDRGSGHSGNGTKDWTTTVPSDQSVPVIDTITWTMLATRTFATGRDVQSDQGAGYSFRVRAIGGNQQGLHWQPRDCRDECPGQAEQFGEETNS